MQEPDAGGCLVTPVNKFLSSWDCFSTVATNHLQSGIILQALNFSSTWTRANTYGTTDHVFWWSPLYYLYTCTRVLTPQIEKSQRPCIRSSKTAETTESLGAYCETTGSSLTNEPFASFRNQHNTSCITVFFNVFTDTLRCKQIRLWKVVLQDVTSTRQSDLMIFNVCLDTWIFNCGAFWFHPMCKIDFSFYMFSHV